jgi:hypothetical protein
MRLFNPIRTCLQFVTLEQNMGPQLLDSRALDFSECQVISNARK